MFSLLFYILGFVSFFFGLFFFSGGCLCVDFLPPLLISGFNVITYSFLFDWVSCFFFSVVCFISGGVFLYSNYYMGEFYYFNLDVSRFYMILFFFVFSMFFLVFSFSWFTLMLGWDGLGVVSFLLVIFYNNSSSLNSGLVTIFVNRLGDCFFLVSFMVFYFLGGLSFNFFGFYLSWPVCFLVVMGCVTKSAQVPFSSWLPLAMAAPTPVSSLVHSSTLVTAGVYLLIRFNFMLSEVFSLLLIMSILTMFLGGLVALLEKDFKKIVAMSTLSQLGFMVFSISSGYWVLAYFHMVFHAFFKSMLFLSTGGLMHYFYGAQDSRYFGGLMSPYGKIFFNMSALSLMGFPFTLGFYSKDTIVGVMACDSGGLLVFFFILSCCFTVSYSIRIVFEGYFLFPSFFSSMGFMDSFMYYFPIISIYLVSVFFGNFFFFNFSFFLGVYGFFDYFFGVVIILLGLLFFCFTSYNSVFMNFFFCMGFMMDLSTYSVSSLNKFNFLMVKEFKWGEVLSGQGFLNFFSLVGVIKGVYYLVVCFFILLMIIFLLLW